MLERAECAGVLLDREPCGERAGSDDVKLHPANWNLTRNPRCSGWRLGEDLQRLITLKVYLSHLSALQLHC